MAITTVPVSPIGITTTQINPPRQTYQLAKPGEVKAVTLGNTDWMANWQGLPPTSPRSATGNEVPAGTVKAVTLGNTDWMANWQGLPPTSPRSATGNEVPAGAVKTVTLGNTDWMANYPATSTATLPASILGGQGYPATLTPQAPVALTPQLEARGLTRVLYDPALSTGATPPESPTPRGYAPWQPNGVTASQVSGWPVIYPQNDFTPQNMWQYNLGSIRPVAQGTQGMVWGVPTVVQGLSPEAFENLARLGITLT
ncbi:MAG: hypothetical protein ACKO37_05020 [Vampirovibrionales bacterium]